MTRRITVRSGSVPRKVVPPASAASAAGVDTDAIHDNVAAEISAITSKASPIDDDFLLIEDSADGDAKKKITIGDLPGGGGGGGTVPAWISHLADRTVGGETVHADDDEFDDASFTGWTLVRPSGTEEVVESRGILSIRLLTTGAVNDIAAYLKAVPSSAPLTIEIASRILSTILDRDRLMHGPVFSNGASVGSTLLLHNVMSEDSTYHYTTWDGTFTNFTFKDRHGQSPAQTAGTGIVYSRLIWVGANSFKVGYSLDGVTWFYEAITSSLTPSHMGFAWGAYGENPAGQRWVTLEYFRVVESDLST